MKSRLAAILVFLAAALPAWADTFLYYDQTASGFPGPEGILDLDTGQTVPAATICCRQVIAARPGFPRVFQAPLIGAVNNGTTITDSYGRRLGNLGPQRAVVGLALHPSQPVVYVSFGGGLHSYDALTGGHLAEIFPSTGFFVQFSQILVSPDGTRLFAVSAQVGSISFFDTATNTALGSVSIPGPSPWVNALATNGSGSKLYATQSATNTVFVIDVATRAIVGTIPVSGSPARAVGLNDRVYVTRRAADSVAVIDTNADTVVATIPVGAGPNGIDLWPARNRAYVVSGNRTISVIDLSTNTVTATFATVGTPAAPPGRFIGGDAPPFTGAEMAVGITNQFLSPIVGQDVALDVAVVNSGTVPGTNVVATLSLPPALNLLSLPPGCSYSASVVTCVLGTVAPGATIHLPIVARTTVTGAMTIESSVSATEFDPSPTNNSSSFTFFVSAPSATAVDLSVTQSVLPDPPRAGQPATFTFTVANAGPATATNVRLTDTVPAGATFLSGSPGCSAGAATVTCTIGTLAPGASAVVSVIMTLPAGTLTNTASVSATQVDFLSRNDTASLTLAVLPADERQIPTLGEYAMLVLALAIGAIGARFAWRA